MNEHICVCICTYQRPQLLRTLLEKLAAQNTNGQFTFSIVVVDNDRSRSAESVVSAFVASSKVPVRYEVEGRQNIARARNKAIASANGNLIAMIDDDEFPTPCWLLNLFGTLTDFKADGVLGPVKPHFEAEPPKWLIEGKFHDRPTHATGQPLGWNDCRSGNVLLKNQLFAGDTQPFRPECLTGEDQDFFRRMIDQGRTFVWSNEAEVYEVLPPARWTRGFLMRRALFQGIFSLRNNGFPPLRIAQSALAAPAYVAMLPIALVLGPARFMNYMVKLSYHVGRLLALVGINPIKQPYVTD